MSNCNFSLPFRHSPLLLQLHVQNFKLLNLILVLKLLLNLHRHLLIFLLTSIHLLNPLHLFTAYKLFFLLEFFLEHFELTGHPDHIGHWARPCRLGPFVDIQHESFILDKIDVIPGEFYKIVALKILVFLSEVRVRIGLH